MNTWTIYKITSPSNKIYIGQTKNFKSRINNYKNGHCKKQVKLFNSITKYGFEEHSYEILEENIISLNLSNEREIYWIKFYDSNNVGLNCSKGGTGRAPLLKEEVKEKIRLATQKRWDSGEMKGMTGKKLSEDHKKAILLSNIGSKRSSETINKLKLAKANRTSEQNENWLLSMNARKGYKHSNETKKKISEKQKGKGDLLSEVGRKSISDAHKGKEKSKEIKEKISNTHKGKSLSKEHKNKLSESHIQFKVKCLDNDTIYSSAREAAIMLNLPSSPNINMVCKGWRKTYRKYSFIYIK